MDRSRSHSSLCLWHLKYIHIWIKFYLGVPSLYNNPLLNQLYIFRRVAGKKTLSFNEICMLSYQSAERGKEGRLNPSTSSSSLLLINSAVWTVWSALNSLLHFSNRSWTLHFPRMPQQQSNQSSIQQMSSAQDWSGCCATAGVYT